MIVIWDFCSTCSNSRFLNILLLSQYRHIGTKLLVWRDPYWETKLSHTFYDSFQSKHFYFFITHFDDLLHNIHALLVYHKWKLMLMWLRHKYWNWMLKARMENRNERYSSMKHSNVKVQHTFRCKSIYLNINSQAQWRKNNKANDTLVFVFLQIFQ